MDSSSFVHHLHSFADRYLHSLADRSEGRHLTHLLLLLEKNVQGVKCQLFGEVENWLSVKCPLSAEIEDGVDEPVSAQDDTENEDALVDSGDEEQTVPASNEVGDTDTAVGVEDTPVGVGDTV